MGAEAGKRTGERVWTEDSIVGRRRVSFLRKKEITIHCFYLATFGVGAWPSCALQLPCSRKHAHTHRSYLPGNSMTAIGSPLVNSCRCPSVARQRHVFKEASSNKDSYSTEEKSKRRMMMFSLTICLALIGVVYSGGYGGSGGIHRPARKLPPS